MEQLSPETPNEPLKQLLEDHGRILGNYSNNRQKAERFATAEAAIDSINDMLSDGTCRLETASDARIPATIYYQDDRTGEYMLRNKILTYETPYSFSGDRLERIDGELVLIDSEISMGVSVQYRLDVQRRKESNTEHGLLGFIVQTQPGEDVNFDCMVI